MKAATMAFNVYSSQTYISNTPDREQCSGIQQLTFFPCTVKPTFKDTFKT